MKKLLLGLGTIAAVAAPVTAVVACSLDGNIAKYVETQPEAMKLLKESIRSSVSLGMTNINYSVMLSKTRKEHNGFSIEVNFTNISGFTYSSKLTKYEDISKHIWQGLKKNFLNPFSIAFNSNDGIVSERCIGYAHGYEILNGGIPSHKDGQLYVV